MVFIIVPICSLFSMVFNPQCWQPVLVVGRGTLKVSEVVGVIKFKFVRGLVNVA